MNTGTIVTAATASSATAGGTDCNDDTKSGSNSSAARKNDTNRSNTVVNTSYGAAVIARHTTTTTATATAQITTTAAASAADTIHRTRTRSRTRTSTLTTTTNTPTTPTKNTNPPSSSRSRSSSSSSSRIISAAAIANATTTTCTSTTTYTTSTGHPTATAEHVVPKGIPGTVGLTNLGNSCYMNCIVQCLVHAEPLTKYMLSTESLFRQEINRTNPLGSGGKVAEAYASLLKAIWSGQHTCISPLALKRTIAGIAPQFQNTRQHDAQEFLSFLMDGLHEDLNRVLSVSANLESHSTNPKLDGDAQSVTEGGNDTLMACRTWKNHLLRNDSIIVDHFQGMQRTSLTCPHCRKQSIKFDVYSSLSLTLEGRKDGRPTSLHSSLEHFTREEQLDDGNGWYCSKCRSNVNAIKCVKLWSTPNILVLHLKRFTFRSSKRRGGGVLQCKIEDVVDFPVDHLNMEPFMTDSSPIHDNITCPPVYRLLGVVEHSGETPDSGHYTATVRNSKDSRFYRCNDSQIGDATDNLKGSGVYLLFYKREKGECRWAGMDRMLHGGWRRQHSLPPVTTDSEGFTMVVGKKNKNKKAVVGLR